MPRNLVERFLSKHPNVQPVILCGGSGTRLWPLSRRVYPKQYLPLLGERSLFQLTAIRLQHLTSNRFTCSKPIIVTGEDHKFITINQLQDIEVRSETIILEPVGRNTAPALTFAALAASNLSEDPVLVVCPADHTVGDEGLFTEAVVKGVEAALDGAVVVLGVTPDKPETGYGYIQATPDLTNACFEVHRFVEKPDKRSAKGYLQEGNYYWNAGIFILRASKWLALLETFRADILASSERAWGTRLEEKVLGFSCARPEEAAVNAIASESIDYAVMEHLSGSLDSVVMIPLDVGWSDLGTWGAIWETQKKDESSNVSIGAAVINNGKNNLTYSTGRLIALSGLDDLVVVETPDTVLVANKNEAEGVKGLTDMLKDQHFEYTEAHRKVYRPWGWYDAVDEGLNFKVKRIHVNVGATLSLQKHNHRAEHWIVVAGVAEVTCGTKVMTIRENESTYIPLGERHRLFNPGSAPLELVEVQLGTYLGEDDIVRFADEYGRGGLPSKD